jgi:hypothetical protein
MTFQLEYHIPVKCSVQRSIPALIGVGLMWRGRPRPRNTYSATSSASNSCRSLLALCALIAALAPCAAAQRAAPAHVAAPRPASHFDLPARSFAFGRGGYAFRFHHPLPYTSLPFPFFGDSFNPDDIYSTGYPVASQPPMILLQAARAMAGSADYLGHFDYDQETPPAQPLVIELQSGRYVRITSLAVGRNPVTLTVAPDDVVSDHSQAVASKSAPAIAAASPPHDLPPALLVFRDGHSEEVRDYTIADGVLYARGDYYTDGYWTKKIELSTLNVAQTLEANTTRSVKFILPSSPNEVITRP